MKRPARRPPAPTRPLGPRLRHLTMVVLAMLLGVGFVLRASGMPRAGWLIAIAGAGLAFVFLMPVMGARARQPADAPERRVHFGD